MQQYDFYKSHMGVGWCVSTAGTWWGQTRPHAEQTSWPVTGTAGFGVCTSSTKVERVTSNLQSTGTCQEGEVGLKLHRWWKFVERLLDRSKHWKHPTQSDQPPTNAPTEGACNAPLCVEKPENGGLLRPSCRAEPATAPPQQVRDQADPSGECMRWEGRSVV